MSDPKESGVPAEIGSTPVAPSGMPQAPTVDETAQKLAEMQARLEKSEQGTNQLRSIYDKQVAEERKRREAAEAQAEAARERAEAAKADQAFTQWASGKSEDEVRVAREAYASSQREAQWNKAYGWEQFKAKKYAAALEAGIPKSVADGWRSESEMNEAINEARVQKQVSEKESALLKRIAELETRMGQVSPGNRATPMDTSAAPQGAARVPQDDFERASEKFAEGRMSLREYEEVKRKYEAQFT